MKKILIASCFYDLAHKIEDQFLTAGLQAELTVVNTTDDLLTALNQQQYDALFSEYSITDIDIWKLSSLINSSRFSKQPVPLFLIQETCETEIPSILSREYRFKVVAIEQITDALNIPPNPDDFKPKLLIIEDDPHAANIAFHALKEHYAIYIANDGETGFKQWQQQRHDLILLDLMLPHWSGEKVLAKVMGIDENQPVIIVTAFSGTENHKNLVINGASEFLGKPYLLPDLRNLCRMVYHRAKLVSEIHYREDKFKVLGQQLWLLQHCLDKNDSANCQRILQRLQAILPMNTPTDDEQISLLQSVKPR